MAKQRLCASSEEQYNERIVYTEAVFLALAGAGGMAFVPVFLVRLGAPSWLIGLYTSLPALVMTLAVLPAGAFVQRQASLVSTVNATRFIFRATVAAFALMPFLPHTLAAYVLVALRSIVAVPGAALNVSVTTLWGRITTPRRRPRMLSMRLAVHRIVAAGVGLGAGLWLDRTPFPANYQMLFLTVLLAGAGSVLTLSMLRMPDRRPEAVRRRPSVSLRTLVPLIRDTPQYRDFAIASFVFRLGMFMPMALFPIMRVRELGSSDGWVGMLLTIQRSLSVVAFFVVGALSSKAKYRRLLWISCIGIGLFPLSMAAAHSTKMLIIPEVLAGLFGPGMSIFLSDTLYRVSPEDRRPAFVAANSFVMNLMRFTGPLLGTAVAELLSIRAALAIGGLLRIAGGLVFWRLGVGGGKRAQQLSGAS